MKSYLRLFLILIFVTFVLNVAQAEIPKNIAQAQDKAVWKILLFDADGNDVGTGTTFPIGEDIFVTDFHVIQQVYNKSGKSGKVLLQKREQTLELIQVLHVDAIEDLVIFKTNNKVSDHLKLSDQAPSGNLFALGFPAGVKGILIHLKEHGIFDYDHNYVIAMGKVVFKGISGASVLNAQGEVVGVVHQFFGNMLIVRKVDKLKALLKGAIGLNCSELSLSECIKKELERLKQNETPRAKMRLGLEYLDGTATMQREGISLLSQASREGHFLATSQLGEFHYSGNFMQRRDLKKALDLTLPIAEDNVFAQSVVARIYIANGNKTQAVYWIRKLEKTGYILGRLLLGRIHEMGYGVEKDTTKALKLYEEAADKGYKPAFKSLEKLALRFIREWEEEYRKSKRLRNIFFGSVDYELLQRVNTEKIKGLEILIQLIRSGYNLSEESVKALYSYLLPNELKMLNEILNRLPTSNCFNNFN